MLKRFFKHLPDTIAAIDLGSNSFHLLVAKHEAGNLQVVDRIKEMVRLGEGLDEQDNLTEESQQRALDCLHRFGQRVRNIPPNGLRVVATGALRKALNSDVVLQKAKDLLGHEIEIISGVEEARLTYLGVSHNVPKESGHRLILDIGGASTEVILGERFEPMHVQSLDIGSATLTQMFFPTGQIQQKTLKKALLYVMLELEPYVAAYKQLGWQDTIGTAGTIKSVERVLSKKAETDQIITAQGVNELYGIREGILYDLIGRDQLHDTRSQTVSDLAKRYRVDDIQSEFVEKTSTHLLDQVAEDWGLDNDECASLLSWASSVREVGLSISHVQYHKHSEYVLKHSVLLGFSRREQEILSLLARLQRSGYHQSMLDLLPDYWRGKVAKLVVLLRLSVLIHRSRSYQTYVDPSISVKKHKITLHFPDAYLAQHPLTLADLDAEAKVLKNSSEFELSYQ